MIPYCSLEEKGLVHLFRQNFGQAAGGGGADTADDGEGIASAIAEETDGGR